ncbi:MAG: hypothetical protein EXQ93_00630 [Alphaproteobacteria bacterium]|nr:hypothetical protein [Alphaproteobacteria bacterium]
MKIHDGKYEGVYEGLFGKGIVWITRSNGKIIAEDAVGGAYAGGHTYDPYTGINAFSGRLAVVPGFALVNDPRVRQEREVVPFEAQLKSEDLGRPVPVKTPYGPVLLTLRQQQSTAA